MILDREQFDTKWADGSLGVVDWFDTTDKLFNDVELIEDKLKKCQSYVVELENQLKNKENG